ncbi:MAG: thioredoxin family protein [Acidobacteria bacterium]|nr:thioredoxin family protein [Acidobacteriota bacterium]
MKRLFLLALIVGLFALAASGQGLKIGATMENFSLPDTNGAVQTLDSLKGEKGALIVFLSAQCPVVKGYHDRINEIAAAYKSKGINFIGINSNATEDLAWVKSNIAEYGYQFPVLIDKNNVFADKLNAQSTPEVFYVDASRKLVYHGAIDNDRGGDNVTQPYLKTAFEESLSGKAVSQPNTHAIGCTIKRANQ